MMKRGWGNVERGTTYNNNTSLSTNKKNKQTTDRGETGGRPNKKTTFDREWQKEGRGNVERENIRGENEGRGRG